MLNLQSLGKVLPFLVGTGLAAVSYPPIPDDLTTPYQQRLAIYGPNGAQAHSPSEAERLLTS